MPNHVTSVITLSGDESRIKAMLEQIKNDEVGILLKCAEHITVSHNATIGLELINGVKLNNITERSSEIGSYDDTCD